MPEDWPLFLKKYYEVPPPHEGVYVLGCFARHVTLYSQQVRALNLIFALEKSGKVSKNTRVAVIGGGAAGLTASAAAAYRKAQVTLFEKFEDFMEYQQNNRQRWIHPYIYDWPFEESRSDQAELPLLPWEANYASNVASDIVARWNTLKDRGLIDDHRSVSDISLKSSDGGTTWVSWNEHRQPLPPPKKFDVVILAVGFGLERQNDFRLSYWTEDDLDCGFWAGGETREWLVSGCGDGAFIDLMRLCTRRFRHQEIVQQFTTAKEIEGVKADLISVLQDPSRSTAQAVSEGFQSLTIPDGVKKIVLNRIRKRGPSVMLITRTPHLYGPRTSVLHRLLVRILADEGLFKRMIGETDADGIEPQQDGGFHIPIVHDKPYPASRVLIRHGPESVLEEKFHGIWEACSALRSDWEALELRTDETRKKKWDPGFFGPEHPVSPRTWVSAPKSQDLYKQYGLWARSVTIYKELRDDGSSTVTFEIKDLSLLEGEVSGIHFYYQSNTGQIGPPRLRPDTQQVQLSWEPDDILIERVPKSEGDIAEDRTLEAREKARRLSGIVRLSRPLKPSDQPFSVSLTFTLQNGDALSSWEFQQMYDPESQTHMDGTHLGKATEYFARIVWFPVETLTLRMTLPARLRAVPYPNVFIPSGSDITADDVVVDSILQFSPTAPSKWRPTSVDSELKRFKWKRESPSHLFETGCFSNPYPLTWELSIPDPALGSCYSLDWVLPEPPDNDTSRKLAQGAEMLRSRFLKYTQSRRNGQRSTTGSALRQKFIDLYANLHSRYGLEGVDERFLVSMMTYQTAEHRMVLVDAVVRGGEPEARMWNFRLPFGLGLAGSCFRQGQVFVYRPPEVGDPPLTPGSYLPIPHGEVHQCLLALPLDHPDLNIETIDGMPEGFERSQQCIGVVNVASDHPSTKLRDIRALEVIKEIRDLCQKYCDQMCSILNASEE